jgi:hypothetical protein
MDVEFETFEELAEAVQENGGLVECVMYQLRDTAGWDRLTNRMLVDIEDQLSQKALGYFPWPMPQGRRDEVRIYKRGTKVGNIVEAVLKPADHKDDLLREVSCRRPC